MLKGIQKKILGKKRFQNFFEKLYHISKFGRNIGLPIHINSSGEIYFIQSILKDLSHKKEIFFFDIGANHGEYTRNLLKYKPSVLIVNAYLFEPQESLHKGLNSEFAGDQNINIIAKACGSKSERINLFSFEGTDTLASFYNNFKGSVPAGSFKQVEVIRIDDFLAEQNISFVDFVKIDVEGHELEVLKGMGEYLANGKIAVIQFEFGSFNIASRTFFKDFWDMLNPNYDVHRILKNGLWKIEAYSPDLEIFDTTNYAAILKSYQKS